MAKTTKANSLSENQKGADMLTKLIYKDVKKIAAEETTDTVTPPVETTPTETVTPPDTTPTETVTPPIETTPPQETVIQNADTTPQVPVNKTTETPTKKPLSIWEQIKRPTQEDKTINTQAAPATDDKGNIVKNLASQATGADNLDNEINAQKQSNKVRAAIMVEIADVIFMFICLLLTWDFSDKNQAKFTLHKDRKAAIEHNLFKLYQVQNKKTEPKKEIFFLILGSYVPMLLVAVFGMIKRLRDKAEDKKRAAEIIHLQNNEVLMNQNTGHTAPLSEEAQHELDSTRKLNSKLAAELAELRGNKNPVTTFGKGDKTNTSTGTSKRGVKAGTKRGSYKK